MPNLEGKGLKQLCKLSPKFCFFGGGTLKSEELTNDQHQVHWLSCFYSCSCCLELAP